MRLVFWLSLAAAVLSMALNLAAMTRVHLHKISTEDAVRNIERALPNPELLTAERAQTLARALRTIRDNDQGRQRVEVELKRVTASGFLALTAIHLAIAGFAWSWSREGRARGRHT